MELTVSGSCILLPLVGWWGGVGWGGGAELQCVCVCGGGGGSEEKSAWEQLCSDVVPAGLYTHLQDFEAESQLRVCGGGNGVDGEGGGVQGGGHSRGGGGWGGGGGLPASCGWLFLLGNGWVAYMAWAGVHTPFHLLIVQKVFDYLVQYKRKCPAHHTQILQLFCVEKGNGIESKCRGGGRGGGGGGGGGQALAPHARGCLFVWVRTVGLLC